MARPERQQRAPDVRCVLEAALAPVPQPETIQRLALALDIVRVGGPAIAPITPRDAPPPFVHPPQRQRLADVATGVDAIFGETNRARRDRRQRNQIEPVV